MIKGAVRYRDSVPNSANSAHSGISPAHLLALVPAFILTAMPPIAASARDLGIRGATWIIAEPDFLSVIGDSLEVLKDSGALDWELEKAAARAIERMEEPEPVAGIAPARNRTTRLFDPTVKLETDVFGSDGTLIAAAGTRINPLEYSALTEDERDLVFIDGRRRAEVEWALGRDRPAKIVLLAGRPLDLARTHGRPFFFDQGGLLAERLGIHHTPTLALREGFFLRLVEIPVDEVRDGPPTGKGRPR